jgi:rare lipoprotein A
MTQVKYVTAALVLACGLISGLASAQESQNFSGRAAHYGKDYKGIVTSGERYDPKKFTAAHRTLPFGTRVLVTDPATHRSVEVVVNDRGPFTSGRVIDLSYAAAEKLGMIGRGLIDVTVAVPLPIPLTTGSISVAR